jgi:hypothetical protein
MEAAYCDHGYCYQLVNIINSSKFSKAFKLFLISITVDQALILFV